MLNAVSDLPFVDQSEFESSDDAPPVDRYQPFRELLKECGFKLKTATTECEWRRELWHPGGANLSVQMAMNDVNGPFGNWSYGMYSGPMHLSDQATSLRILRMLLEACE